MAHNSKTQEISKTEDDLEEFEEELDWDRFESVLVNYDPRPNFQKSVPHNRNVLFKFDFKEPRIPDWLDNYSRITLFKLLRGRIVKNIYGVFNIGEESILLRGRTYEDEECVIKIFKVAFILFGEDEELFSVAEKRKALDFCALQEMVNLKKLASIGVKCPKVIYYKHHALVTSFIGDDGVSARTLGEEVLTLQEYELAYKQVISCIRESYLKNRVCHGDLNENNILWHQKNCYFIDLSQSVTTTHPNAHNYLMMSIIRMYDFFRSKGVGYLTRPAKQFKLIVGAPINFKYSEAFTFVAFDVWGKLNEENLCFNENPS